MVASETAEAKGQCDAFSTNQEAARNECPAGYRETNYSLILINQLAMRPRGTWPPASTVDRRRFDGSLSLSLFLASTFDATDPNGGERWMCQLVERKIIIVIKRMKKKLYNYIRTYMYVIG